METQGDLFGVIPELKKEAKEQKKEDWIERGMRKELEKKIEKNWLDFRDREKIEGVINLTDEEIKEIPLTSLRCWKFNLEGTDCYTNEKGESDYCCPKCSHHERCHKQEKAPLELKWEKLKQEERTTKKAVIEIERRSDKSHLVYCKEISAVSGLYSVDSEGKEKEEIEKVKKQLLEMGFKSENISIKEHFYTYDCDKPEIIEKGINEHSKKLKELLKKKYGFEVTIKVEKKI